MCVINVSVSNQQLQVGCVFDIMLTSFKRNAGSVNSQSKKPALGDVRVKMLMGLKTSAVSARPAWFVWVVPEDMILCVVEGSGYLAGVEARLKVERIRWMNDR